MKASRLLLIALAAAASSSAFAAESAYKLEGLIGFGYTRGGAKLFTLNYTDGTTQDLKAGGGHYFSLGAQARLTQYPVDLVFTVGQHVDKDHAYNAEFRFTRSPIEFVPFLRLNQDWRIGAGLRHLATPKFKANFEGYDYGTLKFKTNNGLVLETEYAFTKSVGATLRYVRERLKSKDDGFPLDANASHWGLSVRGKF